MDFSAVVLAGGESRRMGRDKAWLHVNGQPLIVRALAELRCLNLEQIFVSGRADWDIGVLDPPVLLDSRPGCGPVAGIERALLAIRSTHLLVLAVDLPFMSAEFLRKLVLRCDTLTGVVPAIRSKLEPLAAIYPRRCHAIASACLARGRRSARAFAAACYRQRLVRRYPVAAADIACFRNWNTPDDTLCRRL